MRFGMGWRWMVVALVALCLMFLIGRGIGLSWDPLGLGQRRLARAEQGRHLAEANAKARQLEAEGRARQIADMEAHQRERERLAAATAKAIEQARRAEDANTPIDTARLERLRQHDRQLCHGTSRGSVCSAASDPA